MTAPKKTMEKTHKIYDKKYFDEYYDQYQGSKEYSRENFIHFFKYIAQKISLDFHPTTVLDIGCAKGFLVESLRDLDIEAFGIDISEYALSQVREDIKKYVKNQSVTTPLEKTYDLIVCLEVLEHLPEDDAIKAIKNICDATTTVLFSSSSSAYDEPTHVNIKKISDWITIFHKNGFVPVLSYDTLFISADAMLFEKIKTQQPERITDFSPMQQPERITDFSPMQQPERITDFSEILHKYKKEISSLNNEIKIRDDEIVKRNQKISSLNNEIKIRDDEIVKRNHEIVKRNQEIVKRNHEIVKRDDEIIKRDNELRKRDYEISSLFEQKERLQTTLNELTSSVGFRLIQKFHKIWNDKLPPLSKRRKYVDKLLRTFRNDIKNTERIIFRQFSSLPINEQYKLWLKNNTISTDKIDLMKKEISKLKIKPKISIIMPVFNVDEVWLKAAIDSVRKQIYENWELCIVDDASTKQHIKPILEKYENLDRRIKISYLSKNKGIAGASNKAIELSTGDYIGFLDHDDVLYQNALFEIVKRINEKPDTEFLYSDEDKIDTNGNRTDPYFKPDWSPDLLMTGNYITHFSVIESKLVKSNNGFRLGFDGSQDFDLFLRITDTARKIEHIPKILYGWRMIRGSAAISSMSKPHSHNISLLTLEDTLRRRGIKGTVEQVQPTLFFRVRCDFGNPLVSIVIMNTDINHLKKCIKSFQTNNYKNLELVILTTSDSNISELLSSFKYKIIKIDPQWNISRSYNSAVKHINGEYIIFLNDSIEALSSDWINAMLEVAAQKSVGIVGPMLVTNYGVTGNYFILSAGIVTGVGCIASNAFSGIPFEKLYGRNLHLTIRNCSSISRDCLLIKKEIFDRIGGWDEQLQSYSDIDLCLRVSELGYRVVYTPYPKLLLHNYSHFADPNDELFAKKWPQKLVNTDPFYNNNLYQSSASFGISPYSNLKKPLAILMEAYMNSDVLQKKFPEVKNGKFKALLKWVITEGLKIEPSVFSLRFHEDELNQILKGITKN